MTDRAAVNLDASLTGVVPVVPTIFRDDESVDLEGTARVVDYLLDGEVDRSEAHV